MWFLFQANRTSSDVSRKKNVGRSSLYHDNQSHIQYLGGISDGDSILSVQR